MTFQTFNIFYALMPILSVSAKALKDIIITKLFFIDKYLSENYLNIFVFIIECILGRLLDNAFNKKFKQYTKHYVHLPFFVI